MLTIEFLYILINLLVENQPLSLEGQCHGGRYFSVSFVAGCVPSAHNSAWVTYSSMNTRAFTCLFSPLPMATYNSTYHRSPPRWILFIILLPLNIFITIHVHLNMFSSASFLTCLTWGWQQHCVYHILFSPSVHTTRLHFPASFAAGCGQWLRFGEWDVAGSDVCHFQAQIAETLVWSSTYFPCLLAGCQHALRLWMSCIEDDRTTTVWVSQWWCGASLAISHPSNILSLWDLGLVYLSTSEP